MLQFENYLEQQPMLPTTFFREECDPSQIEQAGLPKKPPRGVGSGGVLEQIMPPVADVLDGIYVWDDRSAVLRFIEENRVRGVLIDAREPLDAAFGQDVIKSLSIVRDEEGVDTLFCIVKTGSELQTARNALNEFDERWWLARVGEAAGKLNFDFDLV